MISAPYSFEMNQLLDSTDDTIRLAAFEWLKQQIQIHGEVLPWTLLERGFNFQGNQIHLVGQSGIWKPRLMQFPLSIRNKFAGKYPDRINKNNLIEYMYRGTDPNYWDNVGLREIWKLKKPLVYLHGIAEGRYFVSFPAYIIADNPSKLFFTVQIDEISSLEQQNEVEDSDATHYRRAYATTTTNIRIHQTSFRERVLLAYQNQCSFCNLRHPELLDAAHIIGDKEDLGDPIVPNGLSLCKIHHAAFDNNIIGVTPDYKLHVREDVLYEIDGPMLKYGLQSMDGNKLILPYHKRDYPDPERLESRYEQFRKAV
jgi:putative restriction endonuclease